jgi:hypothetical protein
VGELLARSGGSEEEALAAELDAVTAAVRALQPGTRAAAPAATPAPAPPARPAAAPAPRPVAPAPPPPRAPAAAPPARSSARAPDAVPETADLIGSWAAYQRLAAGPIGPASLDELLAGAGSGLSGPGRDAGRAAPGEAGVVDVRTLVYRGERALARAQELRAAAKQASGDSLRALIEEVCDLVALALEPTP